MRWGLSGVRPDLPRVEYSDDEGFGRASPAWSAGNSPPSLVAKPKGGWGVRPVGGWGVRPVAGLEGSAALLPGLGRGPFA